MPEPDDLDGCSVAFEATGLDYRDDTELPYVCLFAGVADDEREAVAEAWRVIFPPDSPREFLDPVAHGRAWWALTHG